MCSPSAVDGRDLQHHSMSSCGLDVSDSTAASNFGLVFSFSGPFWSSEAYSTTFLACLPHATVITFGSKNIFLLREDVPKHW